MLQIIDLLTYLLNVQQHKDVERQLLTRLSIFTQSMYGERFVARTIIGSNSSHGLAWLSHMYSFSQSFSRTLYFNP